MNNQQANAVRNDRDTTTRMILLRSIMSVLALTLLYSGYSEPLRADVFQSVDEQGVVHLSNVPSSSQYQVIVYTQRRMPGFDDTEVGTKQQYPVVFPYISIVKKTARQLNLDQDLLLAIIAVESGYDPQATSSEGAAGLMQLMPATALRYGVINRYDPEENIQAGARYLRDLINLFHDDLHLALAAYNAGEDAVVHYGNKIPPFPETRQYVPRVLSLYQRYRLK